MFKIIRLWDDWDAILREKCTEIEEWEMHIYLPKLREMLDWIEGSSSHRAVWLALPQIGIPKRWFVVSCKRNGKKLRGVFINPIITVRSENVVGDREWCLSEPWVVKNVVRPWGIRMVHIDGHMNEKERLYDGYHARVIQHEFDHLEGILITDQP